jgi:hypothetical protein
VSLVIVEERGRCPTIKAEARCLRLARHQSACRFFDADAEMLWQAIADLMGMLPVRYHTGDPTNVREISALAGAAQPQAEGAPGLTASERVLLEHDGMILGRCPYCGGTAASGHHAGPPRCPWLLRALAAAPHSRAPAAPRDDKP